MGGSLICFSCRFSGTFVFFALFFFAFLTVYLNIFGRLICLFEKNHGEIFKNFRLNKMHFFSYCGRGLIKPYVPFVCY